MCVQYLSAIQRLKAAHFTPLRTLLLFFVPDEEVGGADGMGILLKSSYYSKYISTACVALDEGLASENDDFCVFYGERLPWWVTITAEGDIAQYS